MFRVAAFRDLDGVRHSPESLMNKHIASLLLTTILAFPLRGQASASIAPHASDSLAAAERRSTMTARDRRRNLDSLAAGRRRWARAAVREYQIQVHTDRNRIPDQRDRASRLPLSIVRGGAIVGHARGRAAGGSTDEITVDSLFARIERDLREPGRIVRRLALDPRYGFPRDYQAETPSRPDLRLRVQVDSFAVVRRASP